MKELNEMIAALMQKFEEFNNKENIDALEKISLLLVTTLNLRHQFEREPVKS